MDDVLHWRVDDPAVEAAVRDGLAALAPRDVRVRLFDGGPNDHPDDGPPGVGPSPGPSLAIAVAMTDGRWAFFHIRQPLPPMRLGPLFWFGITIVLVILASVWAVHRMTQPLRRLAGAADRLGLDGTAAPLPEHGPHELRNATRAFNRMQDRIRRLVDDRTLMLAAVSHDLRTVLTRLRLRAEFIDDEEQQDKAIADLDEMQAMLDATLSFARDDAADERIVRLDLAALLQSLVDDLADAGHTAEYKGPDRFTFGGRPVALRRAFANLIENAIRYGERADVRLEPHDDGVAVIVADRGPGIPVDMRERVFDPFFRLEASRNRETGGTGLGLAVVRAIVGRHGGDIALEDRPGGGLLVRVTLPVAAVPTGAR
jgi:signal transduction histidine kinase